MIKRCIECINLFFPKMLNRYTTDPATTSIWDFLIFFFFSFFFLGDAGTAHHSRKIGFHYENLPMPYIDFSEIVKIENFQ